MNVKKIVLGVFLTLLSAVIIFIISIQLKAVSTVKDFLDRKIPSHIDLTFKNMSVNILTGTLEVDELAVTLFNRDTLTSHTKISADRFVLGGLNYWEYYMNNTISADDILVVKPEYIYYRYRRTAKTDTVSKGVVNLLKTIKVGNVSVEDGQFTIFKNDEDSVLVRSEGINFLLINGLTGPRIIKKKIPLEYDHYSFSADTTFVDLGPFETLTMGSVEVADKRIRFRTIKLNSKLSKAELSQILKHERDHVTLSIPEISIDKVDFGFNKDRFYIASDSIVILKPDLELYRDKLVADDQTKQRMYGHMLRDLPIDITVPLVRIMDGNMQYEERIHPSGGPGSIYFNDISAEISSLKNSSSDDKNTRLVVRAVSSETAASNVDWRRAPISEVETASRPHAGRGSCSCQLTKFPISPRSISFQIWLFQYPIPSLHPKHPNKFGYIT
jgi:hypothetical protein